MQQPSRFPPTAYKVKSLGRRSTSKAKLKRGREGRERWVSVGGTECPDRTRAHESADLYRCPAVMRLFRTPPGGIRLQTPPTEVFPAPAILALCFAEWAIPSFYYS